MNRLDSFDQFDTRENGGGREIRTLGTRRYIGFRDRRFQPLTHPSENCLSPAAGFGQQPEDFQIQPD